MNLLKSRICCIVLAGLGGLAHAASSPQTPVAFQIEPRSMKSALTQFGQQTGLQIMFSKEAVETLQSQGVVGTYTPEAALQQLIARSGLQYEFVNPRTVRIWSAPDKRGAGVSRPEMMRLAGVEPDVPARVSEEPEEAPADIRGTPEILVRGKRSLNTDIQRTEDDPQPYVVFSQKDIRRSQAVTVEEFLRTRLPMNSFPATSFNAGSSSTVSTFNLRGLGTNQTLILIDGRRLSGVSGNGLMGQPDLNGVPMSAIERIEVLPSTASGIYGGSATGGVINVVLRRDYQGIETGVTYVNTFDTDAGNLRMDARGSFSLEGGRTHVTAAVTHSTANVLTLGDRDFSARSIALQLKNNRAAIDGLNTPPLGATVNIRAVGGALLTLKPQYGSTALGKAITHLPLGYAGPASDMGAALVRNAGQYNLQLPAGANGLERGLVAAPSMMSGSLNVRREFGGRIEAYVDVSRLGNRGSSFSASSPNSATLPIDAPNNPFNQAILVRFPTPGLTFPSRTESTTLRASGGVIARLPHDWMSELSYAWSRSSLEFISTNLAIDSVGSCVLNRGVAANVILAGAGPTPCALADTRPALNALQEGNTFPIDFSPYLLPTPNSIGGPFRNFMKDATLRFSGPVLKLPGGRLNLAVLAERRKEGTEDAFNQALSATRVTTYTLYPKRYQNADSYQVEARAPLFSPVNSLPLVRELELQASVRRDEYRTRNIPGGSVPAPSRDGPFPPLNYTTTELASTDYTVGLRYAPVEDLALRASFGTGFLAPSVQQIAPNVSTISANFASDPRRNNTAVYVGTPITLLQNGNPNLNPELSESISAGVIFTPRWLSNFRLSVDYTRTDKVDEISSVSVQFILDNELSYPGRILRAAPRAQDPAGWAGPITQVDASLLNIARSSLESYDIQVDYTLPTERSGEFHASALLTWQPHYRNRPLPTSLEVDRVGYNSGPLKRRGNLGLDWTKGPFELSWSLQYVDSYWIYTYAAKPIATGVEAARTAQRLNQGSPRIPKQIYQDMVVTYRFEGAAGTGGLLANSEVSVGIQNLFDESPPILAATDPTFPTYSAYGDPRLRRYSLGFRKSFGN